MTDSFDYVKQLINAERYKEFETDYWGRSNLSYMRKFYLAFPKWETVSHKLNGATISNF